MTSKAWLPMRNRDARFLALILLAAASPGAAVEGVQYSPGRTVSARQWDPIDIAFQVEEVPADPFEVDFVATIKNAAGRRFEVPGFYNGGGQYLVRFTPPTSGVWQYTTSSSVPALEGQQGEISAGVAAEGRPGAIVVDADRPDRFRYENGGSYYPIAFECDWLFALDAENPDDIPVTRRFVDRLAESGLNQVVMNVFAYDVAWAKDKRLKPEHDYGSPRVFPFGGDNDSPDYEQLNVEYFKRLDRVVEYLDQKGIAAHLMIYVWNKRVAWPESGSDADNRYFDYVVKRYQAFPNLVWDISKEALGYGHTDIGYISERIERLRGLDAFDRLVTVHDYSYCRRFPKKLDFISVQLWQSELHSVMRNVVKDFPGQPILNIEHGGYEAGPYVVFEGSYTSAEVCLERAYQCVFAGTYPSYYWQGAAWNVIVPDVESLPAAERPRFDYYRHLSELNERVSLGELTAGDKKCNSGFCLHNGTDLYVYYVPKENIALGVHLPKGLRGRRIEGVWFDPFTGEYSEPEVKKINQWPGFRKPAGDRFAVLIVRVLPEGSQE